MSEHSNPETLLEFPCDYGVKAMGESSDQFEQLIINIVKRHSDQLIDNGIAVKQSSGGKYTSVTVTIRAQSKQQLDAIYQELTDHVLVKYAL